MKSFDVARYAWYFPCEWYQQTPMKHQEMEFAIEHHTYSIEFVTLSTKG